MHRNTIRIVQDAPSIQWANGKNEIQLTPGQGRFLAGIALWYSEVGKDDDLDRFLQTAGVTQIAIRHPRAGAAPHVATHWNLGERIALFPLTSGPVAPTVAASLSTRNHAATVEAGIGIRWGRGDGERSKLAIRGYLRLGTLTYPRPVQLAVRSRMTDELLRALIDHTRVCEAADSLIDRAKHPDVVQCYELALPLGAGVEAQWGKGETTTVVPLASLHPHAPDLAYLRTLWRSDAIVDLAMQDWPDVQVWAQEFSYAAESEPAASYEGGGK